MERILGSVSQLFSNISSPAQILIIIIIAYVIRRLVKAKFSRRIEEKKEPPLEPMKKCDFTLEELAGFDGVKNRRILLAINGNVYDVSRGKDFYGPGGPYSVFAGHDASRGLATFSVGPEAIRSEYDDLSDLNNMQWDAVKEWEMQFTERYDLVGKLLKPGEKHAQYEESETEDEANKPNKKKD